MKGEKIAWEEDLPLIVEEEYDALVETIRFSEGFSLLFVECSPRQQTEIIEKIRLDIPQEKIEVLPLDKTVYNFYNRVKELPLLTEVDILFVTGLEYSLYQYEDDVKQKGWDSNEIVSISSRGVPPVLINLNQQRERFRDDFAICFVFLLPRFAIDYLIKRAPDFFDWRSGLFRFPMDREILEYETLSVYFKRLGKEDYETLTPQECRKELIVIQSLIDEDNQTLEKKVDLLVEQGRLNETIGKYLEAISAYEKAIEIKPDNDQAWYNKGNALYNLGRYEQAISAYEKAIEIKPDKYEAWNNKGIALYNLGRYEQAISAYEKAIEIKPYKDEAWNYKGIALYNLGRYEQAISAYEKAIEIKPYKDEAWNNKGNALSDLGRYEQAISAYEKAIEIKPDDEVSIINLGSLKYEMGKIDEAIKNWQAALEINSQFVELQLALGVALYNKGEISEGLEMAERAVKLDKSWGNLQRLKKENWGDKLLADAEKLLENPQIKALLSSS